MGDRGESAKLECLGSIAGVSIHAVRIEVFAWVCMELSKKEGGPRRDAT